MFKRTIFFHNTPPPLNYYKSKNSGNEWFLTFLDVNYQYNLLLYCIMGILPAYLSCYPCFIRRKKCSPHFSSNVYVYALCIKVSTKKVKKRDILCRYEFSMQQFKYPQTKLTSTQWQWQWLLKSSYALSKKQNIYIYDHNYKKLCNFFEFIWKNANVLCEKPAEGPTEFPSSHHNNTVA